MKCTNDLILRIIILFLLVSTKNTVNAQNIDPNPKNANYDIVVIGGTPSGIAAAIAAGRLGKSVIIIEQAPVLGGVLSSGVNRLDDYLVEGNSGIMDEFRTRVMNYNIKEFKNDPVVKNDLK